MPARTRRGPFLVGLLFELALIPVAVLLAWLLGTSLWTGFRWSLSGVGLGLLATLPMLGLFALCVALPWPAFHRIRSLVDGFLDVFLADCGVFEILLISAAAGLGEELLFRGALQRGLQPSIGPAPACLLAALVFGALHAVTPAYAILATLIGLYLGLVWWLSGNLLVPIIAHGLYDFVAILYFRRTRPGPTIEVSSHSIETGDGGHEIP